jgi:hypothetical protein
MLGDDGWVSAAQLQGQGGECLGRLLCNDLGDMLGACVEDLVPFLVKERRSLRDSTLNDGIARGIEGLADNLLEDGSGVRRRLGGLDDGGATGCNGANERADSQLEGEVVRSVLVSKSWTRLLRSLKVVALPNDQGSAQRILPDARPHELVGKGNVGGLLVLCEARQIVGHPYAIVHAPRDLDEVRLECRLAEITLAGFSDERLIVLEGPIQLAQLLDSKLERPGLVCKERAPDLCACGRDLVHVCVLEGG